ncbi:MAG: exonuclease SbcCD subunit D [Anaerolineales bacterium]|jgi:DNA repair exonuclease SbcCD nuclease subunit
MLKVLLLADTHLGFDDPLHPKVQRRRRGADFFANFQKALEPALHGEVDIVVHGGDLFTRSRVPDALVEKAMAPFKQIASNGVPVFLVPGNHEQSRIPLALWSVHPNLHIFRQPGTFRVKVGSITVALSGFPFARRIRDRFKILLNSTGYYQTKADIRLLCLHQAVEGAQVGPVNFTFRDGPDVIRAGDIPPGFSAVLSGHIHRAQRFNFDLNGIRMNAPVVYPGSVERTSFAERDEVKGFALLRFDRSRSGSTALVESKFCSLPARPMQELELHPGEFYQGDLSRQLGDLFAKLDPDSVVRIRIMDNGDSWLRRRLSAGYLRSTAPQSMNVSLVRNLNIHD